MRANEFCIFIVLYKMVRISIQLGLFIIIFKIEFFPTKILIFILTVLVFKIEYLSIFHKQK